MVVPLVKCPRCGTEVFKATKEWEYSAFHVKKFDCEKCEKSFKAYFLEGKISHTIPKGR
jgi:ribosomal protein S27AE